MVEVKPFKGITYNNEKIKNLDLVMSPPYDIISEEMQEKLYQKHDNNYVRLILGKQHPDDDENDNRYLRAKELYEKWLKENILTQSNKPAIFPYKISYKINNEEKTMNGFFILLKIDSDYKFVKAHERTLSKPKADRLNLMRACHSNLEPIQLLYIDENDKIRKKIDGALNKKIVDVEGYDGFNHKLWKIEDDELISSVQEYLDDEILFIADGHHRYQTAINYADEMRDKTGDTDPDASFNYRMVILVNMFDEGLAILPTHRLIKKSDIDIEKVIDEAEEYFDIKVKEIDLSNKNYSSLSEKIKNDIETDDEHKFAILTRNKYYVLSLKDESSMDKFASDRSKVWRTLDVSILHKIILEHFMNINEENLEDHIKYTREDEEAVSFVAEGKFDYSVIMNATKIDELKAVADEGEHMPQKSTYFLPKMLSGLVAYKM
jgi:uncharacterized protein (DUF1015 family)